VIDNEILTAVEIEEMVEQLPPQMRALAKKLSLDEQLEMLAKMKLNAIRRGVF